jgi:hypothetical protein
MSELCFPHVRWALMTIARGVLHHGDSNGVNLI